MSSNGVNTAEDADMAECEDGEKVVTMMDVLQEQQEFEDDANAVLGASDDKNCTYSKGYIKRQAIYACLTCCADAKEDPSKRAGVCLACSLSCHENHELIELYTKRNFRCDCGNPKFSNPCQFVPDKPELNEDNSYNQNFSGIYCTCHRPYPDPDSSFEDEMIQCIICEDWLHASHLETVLPSNEMYAEMICKSCMVVNEFLHDYSDIAVNTDSVEVDVVTVNNTDTSMANNPTECNGISKKENEVMEQKEDIISGADNALAEADNSIKQSESENTIGIEESEIVAQDEAITNENLVDDIIMAENIEIEPHKNEHPEKSGDTPLETEDIPEKKDLIENSSSNIEKADDFSEKKDLTVDTCPDKDNSSGKTDESSESKEPTVGSNNDIPKETKDGNMHNTSDELTTQGENKLDTEEQSNENSIIESIEKLESELGNVEQKEEKCKETQDETSAELKGTENNDQNVEQKEQSEQTQDDTSAEGKKTENNEQNVEQKEDSEEPHDETSVEGKATENNEQNVNKSIETDDDSINALEKYSSKDADSKQVGKQENKDNAEDAEMSETKASEGSGDVETVQNNAGYENLSMPSEPEPKIENNVKDNKRKLSTEETEDTASKKVKIESTGCIRPKGVKRRFKGATFWPSNFRQKLCTCNECISMYKDLAVLFLTDPEDTVTAYEVLGKEKTNGNAASQYEKGLEALSSLDRIQQINALTEYNKMRDKLLDFLKSFKDRKEIVKEDDIKAFFAGMKPKREPDGVYFCR